MPRNLYTIKDFSNKPTKSRIQLRNCIIIYLCLFELWSPCREQASLYRVNPVSQTALELQIFLLLPSRGWN